SMNFMDNYDFYEGVRSVLVDKDRSPKWKYNQLQDVTREHVLSYFKWSRDQDIFTTFNRFEKKFRSNTIIN
ncbi:enoyl-CoA hydratase/isomerase family protein, partial [Neobacillus niacini]|uniref:enoyl-CoA hydratase/isomerase family protein n=1 Tax=Neobacillus niacini TaxID=86668 RepID=UPI002FFFA437